jgi:DNA primase
MATWINFQEIREHLDFRALLTAHGVLLNERRAGRHQGPCPLPTHAGGRASASFSADLDRRIWRCFGCNVGGNALDFAVRMEGLDPESGAAVRKVALRLKAQLVDGRGSGPDRQVTPVTQSPATSEAINAPLGFELKGLDVEHPFFADRGFAPGTAAAFGAGYCSRGSLKGRIAIPLHDSTGHLVAYVGRAVANQLEPDEPLDLYPEPRLHASVQHRLDLGRLVYNAHRIKAPAPKLVVADDYLLAWHFWELGVPVVVVQSAVPTADQRAILDGLVHSPLALVWVRSK